MVHLTLPDLGISYAIGHLIYAGINKLGDEGRRAIITEHVNRHNAKLKDCFEGDCANLDAKQVLATS